jgi:hypothetical protein
MSNKVLYAGNRMRLENVLEALADLEKIFEVMDKNVQGEGKHCYVGVLSPLKIHNHPDDPYISGDSDLDKIERLRKIVRAVGDIRDKWVIT